jgi:streptogramin lyase
VPPVGDIFRENPFFTSRGLIYSFGCLARENKRIFFLQVEHTCDKFEGRSTFMKKLAILGLALVVLSALALQPAWAEQYKLIKHFGCLDAFGGSMKYPTGIFVQEGKGTATDCDDGVKFYVNGYAEKCKKAAALDSTRIYVADMWNNRIEKFDMDGNVLKRWTEKDPLHPIKPYDLVVDKNGSMHISCQYYDRIQRCNSKGYNAHVMNPNHWNYAEIGKAPVKTVDDPRGMAIDARGNIIIADYGYRRIFIFDDQKNFLSSFSTVVDGDKLDVYSMPRPIDVAVDSQGAIYVCYDNTFGVRKFTSSGQISPDFPKDLKISGSDMKLGGIAVCPAHGDIFVTDVTKNMVHKLDSKGNLVTSWGRFGYLPGYFNKPMGIAVDSKDRVYVVDTANSRVQIFAP